MQARLQGLQRQVLVNRKPVWMAKHVLQAGDVVADPEAIAKRRDRVVSRLVKGVTSLTKKNKVDYIVGRGRLEGPQQAVQVAGVAHAAIIASGAPGRSATRW